MGFLAWSLSFLYIFPAVILHPALTLTLARVNVMGKVVAALGMILLVLEDQLAINKAAQERERRARIEVEAYTNLILSRRRVEDFDRQASEICQTVVEHSRFAQAALLMQSGGRLRVAGAAGLGGATVTALDALAGRISGEQFLAAGCAPHAATGSQTVTLDLAPWMQPGDDLKRLHFTSALAVPMTGRSSAEGALLLAAMRNPRQPLRADDLLPVEMLTARLQSVRGQTMMLEKLIDSEKFASLGQLAGNVTQQLNNPLTVILGYGSLLEESTSLDPQERRGIEAILAEARRMRSTLESLSRVAYAQGDQFAAVSVAELLADLEELHRSEFLHRSIDFRVQIASALPRVLCQAQQLRLAVLHCLQFAMDAVDAQGPSRSPSDERSVRIEATAEGKHVQILVAHSGPGFTHPEHAFDPFMPAQVNGETAGLGLSFCATILRDNNGQASAVNLDPHGAAIILELQAA
jgi:signal transduction histidine kinase